MKKKNKSIRENRSDMIFNLINNLISFLILIIIAYPVLVVVSSSFSDPYALMAGKVWLFPIKPTLMGYEAIMNHKQVWTGLSNSAFYTIVGTILNLVVTILAAYPLSRKDLSIRGVVSLLFAFTMWFSGGLIPTYLLIKDLGLFNSRLVMFIPSLFSVWNMVILRTYFESSISPELFESARLDGCDDFTYLIRIAVPLAKPSLAVLALYYMVGNWNVFQTALLYLNDEKLYPIQIILRQILLLGNVDELQAGANPEVENQARLMNELLKYSLVIVASMPLIVVYPFVQKYFVKGMMVGSVKG